MALKGNVRLGEDSSILVRLVKMTCVIPSEVPLQHLLSAEKAGTDVRVCADFCGENMTFSLADVLAAADAGALERLSDELTQIEDFEILPEPPEPEKDEPDSLLTSHGFVFTACQGAAQKTIRVVDRSGGEAHCAEFVFDGERSRFVLLFDDFPDGARRWELLYVTERRARELELLLRRAENARLYDWYLTETEYGCIASGTVTGHRRLTDGRHIHTSPIRRIDVDEHAGTAVIHTMNTDYHCALCDMCFEKTQPSELLPGLERYRQEYGNAASPYETAGGSLLLVLGNNREYYFGGAVLNLKGKIERWTEPDVHVGSFQDSVLIENERVDLRYFPYKQSYIECYTFPTELPVFAENCGNADFFIRAIGQTFRLAPGERKRLCHGNAESVVPELGREDLYNVFDEYKHDR